MCQKLKNFKMSVPMLLVIRKNVFLSGAGYYLMQQQIGRQK